MDPVTTVTAGLSSLVPCPKALSVLPEGLSMPVLRPATLAQSVFPGVFTTRLPSLPSKVLPARFAPDEATKNTANAAAAATVSPIIHHRPPRRCRDLKAAISILPTLVDKAREPSRVPPRRGRSCPENHLR